ncbi:MAG: YhcH/YjgK/YiaL family protein [Ruthenibacterium sp.]
MLYDTLENLNQYTGLFENLDTAIAYLTENDVAALPLGRTDIDGDKVYVNVMEVQPTPTEGRAFETHSRYMDLQMDLEGVELCEVALGETTVATPYDEAKDFAEYHAQTSAAMVLGAGRFAVFMIEEPHKPTIKAEGCDKVKKAVFKIAYESC